MNYLAHAFLSFYQPEIVVGNMISDFIKGRKKFDYPPGVQTGISLHRAIDEFTDFHPATIAAKQCFRPVYRLYSAAFIDIVYDYFLANDAMQFPTRQSLQLFTEKTYATLTVYESILPPGFRSMLPYMKAQNWLYNYHSKEGIRKSFGGLVRRAAYLDESDLAFEIFEQNTIALQQCYNNFFPALKTYAAEHLSNLQKKT